MERCVLSTWKFVSTIAWPRVTLLCILAGSAYAQPGTLNCGTEGNLDGPNVAVLSYCSVNASPTSAAGGAIKSGLCSSGFFNSVDLIDGDVDEPTADQLQVAGYQCAVVITEAGFNDSNCGLGPAPGHVLDTAASELAAFAASSGGVVLLGGSMGPTTDESGSFRTEGLGDAMVVDGPSPYGRGPLPEGDRGGGPMNFSPPSGLCEDILSGVNSGDYTNLRVFEAGALKDGATECSRIVPASGPDYGALAIDASGKVAAFTANPIVESIDAGADTGNYLHLLSNTAFVVCRSNEAVDIQVSFDVRPGTCPNPFNPDSNGKLPVTILGTPDIDVNDIDISSIEVFGVAPEANFSMSDTGTPFAGTIQDPPQATDCTAAGFDGTVDLNLKFPYAEVAQALTNHVGVQLLKDQTHVLTITGTFATGPNAGKSFVGQDVVTMVKDGPLPTEP